MGCKILSALGLEVKILISNNLRVFSRVVRGPVSPWQWSAFWNSGARSDVTLGCGFLEFFIDRRDGEVLLLAQRVRCESGTR